MRVIVAWLLALFLDNRTVDYFDRAALRWISGA